MPYKPSHSHPRKRSANNPKPKRNRAQPSRHRRLRCDCGRPAITVLWVKVGIDPQYTIRLPLCAACLVLEQSFTRGD